MQRASDYRDTRIIWYGLHLAGWLVGLLALSPLLPDGRVQRGVGRRRPWYWLGLAAGVAAGTAVLWLLSQVFSLAAVGGLAVGGGLGLWFLSWVWCGCWPASG